MNPDISNIHSGFGWILTPRCAPSGAQRWIPDLARSSVIWARPMGPGPAPGLWGLAHWAWVRPGPMGPCPLGPGPARAQAQGALPIGPNGPWPIWGSKNRQKKKVPRMKFSIVENARTSSDIVVVASRGLQLPHHKHKKSSMLTNKSTINYFFCIFLVGVYLCCH